jgi:hypothetical protein
MPRRRPQESLFGFDLLKGFVGDRSAGWPAADRARDHWLDNGL